MQSVEFAQHGGDGFSPLFRLALTTRTSTRVPKDVGLLLLQR
jgi:hypothetical protein